MFERKAKSNASGCASPADHIQKVKDAGETRQLNENMEKIHNKIVVFSGKGGVGKSTVAVNLAVALAARGYRTGLLDIDIHGPSVPVLLGMNGEKVMADSASEKIIPALYNDTLKVVSVGFFLEKMEDAVVWRGPLKYNMIKQFLKDVAWGELDYLIIDSPPGTGDEPLSVCQLIKNPDGALIVTTPQDVALADVMKSITFCKMLNMPVIGVIENMSGFVCPHCGGAVDIFKSGGALKMAADMGVPFLGRIPLETRISEQADAGKPFVNTVPSDSSSAQSSFDAIVAKIVQLKEKQS